MAKAIMVQGTMSNAGKSVVAAGLCRIFHQDGYRVAPFKSQNMALNSFITREGLEMGRAQVMQAEAAGIEPSVRMNPILLKPTTDTGSQVIVTGEVLGNMSAAEYFRMKKSLVPDILKAYRSLADENDILVLEGAGSPAEINLKTDDIVNMGMAKMAQAPVLLVGDIDRGGVFASLYGTVALLEPEERAMIKGLVINKFRGDVEILRPGLSMLEELTGIPVVGVLPYLSLDLDDEDSLSQRLTVRAQEGLIDAVVIRLPRISNFTDFNTLSQIPGVGLRYAARPEELGQPDLILLPGTKNTMGDLRWMRQNGLEAAILRQHSRGVPVMGICGGYQMMGRRLEDPDNLEDGGTMAGMGLLNTATVFQPKKVRTRVEGRILSPEGIFAGMAGVPVTGYEIHMGETVLLDGAVPLVEKHLLGEETITPDGAWGENACGTYLHGVFDSQEAVQTLVTALFHKKGLDPDQIATVDLAEHKEREYDRLAQALREGLDLERIYRILEKGI